MTENFAELFEETFASKNIKSGSIIIGTVIEVNDDIVLVSAGLKSEAVIPLQQFYTNNNSEVEISVGDEIEVVLDAFEDGFGETRLSREKAIRARTWIDLEEAHNNGDIVIGLEIQKLIKMFSVKHIVETGTSSGESSSFMALVNPDINIDTIEYIIILFGTFIRNT